MSEQQDSVIVTWSSIWSTTVVAVGQSIVFYCFFLYQRSKDKKEYKYDLYEPRQHNYNHRSPEPFAKSWLLDALRNVDDDELLRCVGLDSYMFLRFLRMCTRISILGVLFCFGLAPIYATGNKRGDDTIEFNQLTLARVESNSIRLWATLIAWCIFVIYTLYEFRNEWKNYSKLRYDFLAKGDIDTPRDFRYAIRVEQIPEQLRDNTSLHQYFERIFPGKVRQANVYLHIESLQKLIDERQSIIESIEKTVAYTKAKPDKPVPQVKVGGFGCCGGTKVDAIQHFESELERLNGEVDECRATILEGSGSDDVEKADDNDDDDEEKKATLSSSSGVVTFTSLRSKQSALQCQLCSEIDTITTFPVADPDGTLWNNVTMPLTRQRVLEKQAAALWIVGILFWAFPVAFVSSLANLNSLLKTFGLPQADPTTFWYGIVAGLLPVIFLAILMAVLYMSIVAVAKHWIKYKSTAEVDTYALYWHQLFQFANLWLLLIGGSLFNQLDSVIDDPNSIIDTIAAALPGASVFFVNMLVVNGIGSFGMELSMLPTYGIKLVMNLIQPEEQRTQRMLDDAKKPPNIEWGQTLPPIVFVFLVMIVYMPIVPIMEIFACVYFAGTYCVYKHQCLHVYCQQQSESGGISTWVSLFNFLMGCLYVGELVFVAYMGIKEAPIQASCGLFIPFGLSIIMHIYIRRNILRPLQYLSMEVAANVDIADGELSKYDGAVNYNDEANAVNKQLYGQPALKSNVDEREPIPYRRDIITSD